MIESPLYTLSRRAPSATRTPHHKDAHYKQPTVFRQYEITVSLTKLLFLKI